MLIELAALAYCADKSNKMDAQALAKRSKAFTKEAEARDLVYQKRSTAEKKMQNVAKKKRAIIESTLPRFVEVYQKIQKIDLTISDKNELAVYNQFQKSNAIQAMQVVIQKPLTDGQLITEYIFKGIGGMMIADSKRNLSAAKSQLSAANVVYSQAQSVAEVYDAIIGRAERIASLLMRMNALFLGSIFETEKVITQNGTNAKAYNQQDMGILMTCDNLAGAMSEIINIPVLDENGELCKAAVEMIQTGEAYIEQMNDLINLSFYINRSKNYETDYDQRNVQWVRNVHCQMSRIF